MKDREKGEREKETEEIQKQSQSERMGMKRGVLGCGSISVKREVIQTGGTSSVKSARYLFLVCGRNCN